MEKGMQFQPQSSSVREGYLLEVPQADIEPNPSQPRRRFPRQQIEALAASLQGQGVLQPLLVRPHPERPGSYQLVAGERRLRAIRQLGWPRVPVLVREISDQHLLEAALVENLQREQLTPIEEAGAYRDLLNRHGYTQETLAGRIGKDRSTIANMIRLLSLPPALQEDLEEGRLSTGHARALLAVQEPDRQVALRNRVLEKGLSVRETEQAVRNAKAPLVSGKSSGSGGGNGAAPPALPGREDIQYEAARDALEQSLGSRVEIRREGPPGRKSRGRIEIDFYSMEDFNRLFERMTRGR